MVEVEDEGIKKWRIEGTKKKRIRTKGKEGKERGKEGVREEKTEKV